MSEHRHLLVTNDFPPKVGGIQSYLWELWSRLDPSTFRVLSARSDPRCDDFDAEQRERGLVIDRVDAKTLFFPSKRNRLALTNAIGRWNPDLVLFDPAWPLGMLAKHCSVPSAVIVHGAEVAIPSRLPVSRSLMKTTVRRSSGVIAAGPYPAREIQRLFRTDRTPVLEIPPGVDTKRFHPRSADQIRDTRERFGIPSNALFVLSVSRLVPRKGMDTLIKAAGQCATRFPNLFVGIGGSGRDENKLAGLIESSGAPVKMLGRVSDADLPDLMGAADIFAMACRERWGGLEKEGFGIVFLEAAASGVVQIAGLSGGSADAVLDGETGIVMKPPNDEGALAQSLSDLLEDSALRERFGGEARVRAEASFDYDVLARRLGDALQNGWPFSGAEREGGEKNGRSND